MCAGEEGVMGRGRNKERIMGSGRNEGELEMMARILTVKLRLLLKRVFIVGQDQVILEYEECDGSQALGR